MKRPYRIYCFPQHGPAVRSYRYLIPAWCAWVWLAFLGYTARLYDIRNNKRIASA